ncbi:TatD family hydrolase [Paenibacillus sp. PL2-23]|uniref:TatD family hydrolase n=1 Tax=Paenibacillus sp. PL2-23 TaxID=2100729 RepID=UPI0030F85B43
MTDRLSYIDAHIHAELYEDAEQERLLEAAFREGVQAVVAVSMHLASCKRTAALAARYPGQVLPAYGFHPEQEPPSEEERERLLAWIRHRHASGEPFAIGEVGLPYYMRTERQAKGEAFDEARHLKLLEAFVRLAAELNRPIVLHAVYEDADKACELLCKHGVKRAHFHWFKGSAETTSRMAQAGYFISVTPDIVYEEEIAELARRYPLELMMVETDGPWPFDGPFEGMPTRPQMVKAAAERLAEIKGIPVAEAASALLRNTKLFYNL